MTSESSKSPYRCHFCRDELTPEPLRAADYLRLFLLLRPFQCPHCFQTFYKPFCWIGRLPLISRIVQGTFRFRQSSNGRLPQREGDPGTTRRRIAAVGRWVSELDGRVSSLFAATLRRIRHFFSSLLKRRKRKKGSSQDQFLKRDR